MLAADWLTRYNGTEIIEEGTLDQLAKFGVTYSRIEGALCARGDGDERRGVPIRVYHHDELLLLLRDRPIRHNLIPGNWRGVYVIDVARALCMLAGLGDPAMLTGGTMSRHDRYIAALMRSGLTEG